MKLEEQIAKIKENFKDGLITDDEMQFEIEFAKANTCEELPEYPETCNYCGKEMTGGSYTVDEEGVGLTKWCGDCFKPCEVCEGSLAGGNDNACSCEKNCCADCGCRLDIGDNADSNGYCDECNEERNCEEMK